MILCDYYEWIGFLKKCHDFCIQLGAANLSMGTAIKIVKYQAPGQENNGCLFLYILNRKMGTKEVSRF